MDRIGWARMDEIDWDKHWQSFSTGQTPYRRVQGKMRVMLKGNKIYLDAI